LYNHMYRR